MGKRRRGPPGSKRKRTPPAQAPSGEEGEWYDDVVDNSQTEERSFGGFSVKRPQMSNADQVESQQLERYFEKQYHEKSTEKRESIEEDWGENESEFSFKSLLGGYRTTLLGVQSFLIALPLILISAALVWVGHSVMNSTEGSSGALLNIMMVFLAICLTTISFIQIVVSAVNQSLRERQIAKDGPDLPLLGWSGSLRLSSQLFTEVILTFLVMWTIQILGLYLLAGAIPDLSMPTIDTDNISVGTLLYMLGSVGSLFVMIGIIPYSIEATIKRS